MHRSLDDLLRHPGIWRPGEPGRAEASTVPTGFAALDRSLPGGGWPGRGLIELGMRGCGIGEMHLLLPAFVRAIDGGRRVVLVHPPHVPYAPALLAGGVDVSRVLWVHGHLDVQAFNVAEQALRSGACGVVATWLSGDTAPARHALRRLQLAAEEGRCQAVVLRDGRAMSQTSPALLRALLEPAADGLVVEVLKCRGRSPGRVGVRLPVPA